MLEEAQESCCTETLLSCLTRGISSSSDRFEIISCLDVLDKLCRRNEHFLGEIFVVEAKQLLERLISYLSLHDIHLIISTLECLYALTSLGETSCNVLTKTNGAIDSLVSLVTVEAQSYGPKVRGKTILCFLTLSH